MLVGPSCEALLGTTTAGILMMIRNCEDNGKFQLHTLELASALASVSGSALRLLSGTITPWYGQGTVERLQTTNLVFPSVRSAPVAPPSTTSGLAIDTNAIQKLVADGIR